METKLQKWGNSTGIRIPNTILQELGLKASDIIDLVKEDGKIIITPKKKHLTFKERIANYKGETKVEEYDWGEPEGRELW